MSNPHTLLGSALYSVLSAGTVDVVNSVATQEKAPPYGVMQPQNPGTDDYTFTSDGFSADWVVKVISNRQWPGEAAEIYGHLHDLMQDAALSVPGYTTIRCRRLSAVHFRDDQRFWHVGGVYRVDCEST